MLKLICKTNFSNLICDTFTLITFKRNTLINSKNNLFLMSDVYISCIHKIVILLATNTAKHRLPSIFFYYLGKDGSIIVTAGAFLYCEEVNK